MGAAGGSSGGGAGGVSAGVVFKGRIAPTLTETPVTKDAGGEKGIGGTPGMNDGINGASEDVFDLGN